MAKVFLDTNAFIDVIEDRDGRLIGALAGHEFYVSVLSISTWAYIYKHGVPNAKFEHLFDTFSFADATCEIVKKSFLGPTNDFEDNIQLHSAAESNCTIFVTKDKMLLKLGYFGKVRICSAL